MSDAPRSGPRDNLFLIAAVALPVVVVGLFLVASAVPRWTVAPPAYDLLLRTEGGYNPASAQIVTAIRVRDSKVVAELQPAAPNTYPQKPGLYVFNHETGTASEITYELPTTLDEGEKVRILPIERLADRRILEGGTSPDGYVFDVRYRRGPGVVGELFGMGRYDAGAAIAKNGRVVRIEIANTYTYSVQPVGWLASPEVH
jgi:hypothetical protein